MKRYWSSAFIAAVFVTTAVVGAQGDKPAAPEPGAAPAGQQPGAPPAGQQPGAPPAGVQRIPPAPSEQAKPAGTVTMTGCIQDTPAVAADAGRAAGPAATKTYFLNNVMAADAGAGRGAVGTSGSATGFRLEGDAAVISPHLNHQVRIVGTLERAPGAGAPGPAAAAPSLRVESVTMLAAKCEEKK